jgi:hypothetical protein
LSLRARRASPLSAAEFFEALPLAVLPRVPIELRGFETLRGRGRLLKLHYGRPETHFEAWHHSSAGRLEIGLHFEGRANLNSGALEFFRGRILEVKSALPRAELEPWDRGWSRLYETLPAPVLDDRLVHDAGELMARYITTLKPLLDAFSEREAG